MHTVKQYESMANLGFAKLYGVIFIRYTAKLFEVQQRPARYVLLAILTALIPINCCQVQQK